MDKYSGRFWFRGKYSSLISTIFLGWLGVFSSAKAADLTPLTINKFDCGLQTTQDATLIDSGCSPDLLNVDLYSGSIEKRRASIKQNPSTLGGFTSQSDRLAHEFPDSSGNFWLLSVSSNSLFKSPDGGASNTLLTSTYGITSSSLFSGVNAYGKAYLTDGTTNWILFDGNTLSVSTVIPHGLTSAFFGERLWTSVGTTLYASRFGDPTDWTTDTNDPGDAFSAPIRQSDGYSITALKPFRNGLLVFKAFSIDFVTLGSDGLTPTSVPITSIKGTQHPRSVQVVNDTCIFLADDGFWRVNGPSIEKISIDIVPTVKGIQQLSSFTRSHTETLQSDFTGVSTQTSKTILPNSIVLSTYQFIDTDGADFGAGSFDHSVISTTTSAGSLIFVPQTSATDNFSDGNYTSNPVWTTSTVSGFTPLSVSSTCYRVNTDIYNIHIGNSIRLGVNFVVFGVAGSAMSTPITVSSSNVSFSAIFYNTNSGGGTKYTDKLLLCNHAPTPSDYGSEAPNGCISAGLDYNGGQNTFVGINGTTVTLSSVPFTGGSLSTYTVTLAIQGRGNASLAVNGTTYGNLSYSGSPSTFSYLGIVGGGGDNQYVYVSSVSFNNTQSTFTSRSFSLGSNIGTYGLVTISTALAGGSINFTAYSDSNTSIDINNSSTYISSAAVTTGSSFALGVSSYVFYSAQFNAGASLGNVYLNDITLDLKPATGTYQTADIAIGSAITSWRPILFTDTPNSGTIDYSLYVDSDSSRNISDSTTFIASQTIVSGVVPTVSTNSHAIIVSRFGITAQTQNPILSDYTLSWNEGATAFPVASVVYENDYLCAVSIDSTSVNDTILVFDRNESWTRYKFAGYAPYSMTLYRQQPYVGSAYDGTIYRIQVENQYSDAGNAINSYFTSKEFDFGYPLVNKQMERYYITASYNQLSTYYFEYGVDRGNTTATTINLATNAGFSRSVISPSSLTYSHGTTHRFKISNSNNNQYFKIQSVTVKPRLETAP